MEVIELNYKNILKNVNYDFEKAKIYGIIGYQTQTSMFLELLRGLEKPTRGVIKSEDNKIFMLFADSEKQIVNENVKSEILDGLNESEVDLDSIVERLNLTDEFFNKKTYKLSSGEKRKLVIATMLAHNPNILLVDNFLNSLDYENQKIFINILKRMQFDDHKTIIIADQNINLLYEIASEFIVLDHEILISGDKYAVFSQVDLLSGLNIEIPFYIEFSNLVKEKKGIDLEYRDRLTDLVKDVYDNV